MPSYVIYALLAYLLLAVHGVVDKFLLNKAIRHPIAYTFYAGTTTIFVILLAPFGLQMLSAKDMLIAVAAGGSFLYATYYLYSAIQRSSVSRVLPIEGGLVPIFTYIFAHYFLGEVLSSSETTAFLLLTTGSILMAIKKETGRWGIPAFGSAVMAAVLFALSLVLSKYIYDASNLVTGLVWSRLGMFILALAFLLFPRARRKILDTPKEAGESNAVLFYVVRFIGAIAGLLQNYAIAIGSVVIVNALQGLQFTFILLLTVTLSHKYPKILKENISPQTLAIKLAAIALITIGLVMTGAKF
jgi:drug/metabolite transporter (DMT)-like permease